MAVRKCCIDDCKSRSTRKEDKGVTYHKFPKDLALLNEWNTVTHHKHTNAPAFVCSRHFCKGDFKKNKDLKYVLKSDAVPSIFSWTTDPIEMDSSQTEANEPNESLDSTIKDEKNISSSSNEAENLEAIKKFIEQQEKEIQELEAQIVPKSKSNNDIKVLESNSNDAKVLESNSNDAKVLELNSNDAKVQESNTIDPSVQESNTNDEEALKTNSNDEKALESNPNDEKALESNPNDEEALKSNSNDEKALESNPNDEKALESNPNDEEALKSNSNDKMPLESNPNHEEALNTNSNDKKALESNSIYEEALLSNSNDEKVLESNLNDPKFLESNLNNEKDLQLNPNEEEALKSKSNDEKALESNSNNETVLALNSKVDTEIPESNELHSKDDAKCIDLQDEKMQVASSVMDMILSESEAKIVEKALKENVEELPDNLKEMPKKPVCVSEKSDQTALRLNEKGNSNMSLSVGSKVEAKDFGDDWHPAQIVELDYDEMEVLVHYEHDLKRHDEWISVSSPRLRPLTATTAKATPEATDKDIPKEGKDVKEESLPEPLVVKEEKPKVTFEVGERCLARWRDNRRFIATVHKDLGDGKFDVIFDDGFLWTCNINRLHKLKSEKTDFLTIETSFQSTGTPSPIQTGGPSNLPALSPTPPFHTHLFDPTRDYLSSKRERREMKRKINIKEIFNIGQKKSKVQKTEKNQAPKPPVEKKPRVVKKAAAKVPKVEVKKEIPDAVASIIGTVSKDTPTIEIKTEPTEPSTTSETPESGLTHTTVKPEVFEIQDVPNDDSMDMDVDMIEPEGCVVNPDDKTLDDEEMDEPKSEGDSVLDEEIKLENFEKPDNQKHEAFIDKMKEAIHKLEGGLKEIEETDSPKVEKVYSPIDERIVSPKNENMYSPKIEIDDTKDLEMDLLKLGYPKIKELTIPLVKEELPSREKIQIPTSVNKPTEDPSMSVTSTVNRPMKGSSKVKKDVASNVNRPKKDISKIKKNRKLRLLQQKKVKNQVERVKSELEEMKKQFEEMRKHMMRTEEFSQGSHEVGVLPETFLLPGEWCCKWVNGQPAGKVSEMEAEVRLGLDNKPPLPRRSVQVEDKRLPPGWTKHMVRRSFGHSAGKWDVVLVSPENKRFHTKTDMRNFLENNTDPHLKQHEDVLMDFGVHLKLSRRMGWIINTPDGKAKAPETIVPAGSVGSLSPLVKHKSLNPQKKVNKIKKKKKRRPIKLKLHRGLNTYNSQLIGGESSAEVPAEAGSTDPAYEPLMPLEDGFVYVGSLKVQIIDNLLRCPAEACFKNFRNNTLLQMHIKHYHPELIAMMGATPKVLDLAYARTQPNEADTTPQFDKKVIKVKICKPQKREEPKLETSDIYVDATPITPTKSDDAIPRSRDSPKLRHILVNKPVKRPRVLLPVRRLEEQTLSEPDEQFDNEFLEPVVDVPMLPDNLDFETAISTHTVTKPLEKKKKGDKKKSFASISKNISEDEEWFAMNSDELETRSSFPRSGSPDSKIMEFKMAQMSSESNEDQKEPNLYAFTETGERIKIVHMKREEIINCHCGLREEDGLMVQCELCLCWQHALCHNIQRECEVPEKYTCSICLNPRRGRRSKRFVHDQDRLYEGLLPGARPAETLRRAHELAGNLLRVDDALHALRVKYYVATKKDHPKLYLWAKDWEQAEITYTQERLNSDYSDLNIMINGMDKENLPLRDELAAVTPPSEEQDSDRLSTRDTPLGTQALLSGLLSSPSGASLDLPISTSELERLARTVQESAEWQRATAAAAAPVPEAAIDNDVCRARLLKHIQRCQALIDTRLDSIEAQVAELESQEPSFGEHCETAEHCPRTKQTVQMLMRDLDTMEELGVIT